MLIFNPIHRVIYLALRALYIEARGALVEGTWTHRLVETAY